MTKYNWNTFCNSVAFLASDTAPGTRHPHHNSELTSCYHESFLPWDQYHYNNIMLFDHDSPITRSHFVYPTDCVIRGFYYSNLPICPIWACPWVIKLVESGTTEVHSLLNTYLWNHWMDLHCLKSMELSKPVVVQHHGLMNLTLDFQMLKKAVSQ